MPENPGIPADLVELYWPFVAWFIIGFMCGAAVENWARRSHIAKHDDGEGPAS